MLTIILTDRPHCTRPIASYLVDVKQYAARDANAVKQASTVHLCAPYVSERLVQTPVHLMVKTLTNTIVKRIGEKAAIYAIIQAYNHVITLIHFKFNT